MLDRTQWPQDRIAQLCRRNRVRKLSVFGSALTERFGPASDLDLLVEFDPGQTPSLVGMAKLEAELTEILGRKVDLRTPAELSRYFRDDVLRHAELRYAHR
ncbi:MAG: nucleotidyltransferase [Acidobacteria bacterium]|nr:nucleotidyltransferase [Acidobacteriota bacterium]